MGLIIVLKTTYIPVPPLRNPLISWHFPARTREAYEGFDWTTCTPSVPKRV